MSDDAGRLDIDPQDGGREVEPDSSERSTGPSQTVATVLTKLQKWGDYPAWGQPLLPTKFIPTKTPLSEEIISHWSVPGGGPKHRLTVSDLLTAQQQAGRKIGMILDLSNHDCLYTEDIPPDLHYEHIKLVAKELPPPEFVIQVCARANHFWTQHPDEFIGIHCAYGFNRTGFVLCCYLISQLGMTVDEALEAFKTSRPPGVKHREFRNELRVRYEPGSPLEPAAPPSHRTESATTATASVPSSASAAATHTAPSRTAPGAAAAATAHVSTSGEGGPTGGSQTTCLDAQADTRLASAASDAATACQAALESTPAGQRLVHATPTTENDSLGADQRAVLEGLRANGLLSGSPKPVTPTQLDSVLAAAATSPCSTGHKSRQSGLQRRSVGEIDWGAADDALSPPRVQPHTQSQQRRQQHIEHGRADKVAATDSLARTQLRDMSIAD